MANRQHNFFEDVWAVVREIPAGRVTNYGSIAKYLGSGMSSRMVGWAMNAAHGDDSIPAHRVVNRLGMLSGKAHFATPTCMEEKLTAEGVEINNDCITHFKNHFWDPQIELDVNK